MRQIRLRHSLEDFSRIGSDCGQRSDHFVVRPTVSVTGTVAISLLIITMTSYTNMELGEVPPLHWNVNDVFGHEYRAHAQLMRPGIGRNASCAVGDFAYTSRPVL